MQLLRNLVSNCFYKTPIEKNQTLIKLWVHLSGHLLLKMLYKFYFITMTNHYMFVFKSLLLLSLSKALFILKSSSKVVKCREEKAKLPATKALNSK